MTISVDGRPNGGGGGGGGAKEFPQWVNAQFWIETKYVRRELSNRKIRDFAVALRARNVLGAFEKWPRPS